MKGFRNVLYKSLILGILTVVASISYAQDSKKEKQLEKAAAIENLVHSKKFVFVAETMNPMGGRTMFLNSMFDLRVTEEKIDSDLPYFGRAYVAPIDLTRGALNFTSEDFDYTVREGKKGSWDVMIHPKDNREVRQMYLSVTSSGNAYLQVLSNNRQAISFNGRIEELKSKTKTAIE